MTPTTAQQATDVKVIQRQRDELRIRIQHLLHLLHESQDKVSEQATEIQVLKHALSDEFLGNVTIEGLSLLDNDSRADTRKFRKTDASQLPKDTTLDSVFGNPQALQTAAHLESLQSELAAYKSTCTKLDERVNSLSMQLMNERNHHLKDVKELEAQIGSMKCFHCGQAMSPTGRSTPTLNGVRKATQIHSSEPLAQSTFDQSTLESFLDGEAPHRTAVQTIYRSDSKNLVLENHEAVSPVKWMDMEQKPFHMDGYAPENASLSFYPATEIHLDPYGVRNTEPQPASSVSTPHGLPSQTILENVSSVPPTKLNHVASQQAGNPLLEKPALSSVPKVNNISFKCEIKSVDTK